MRGAHGGGADPSPPEPARPDASLAASPPTVPMVEEPPVAAKLERAPEAKLSFMAPAAREAACRMGAAAALPAARPMPARPEATPDAPDRPAEARLSADDAPPA